MHKVIRTFAGLAHKKTFKGQENAPISERKVFRTGRISELRHKVMLLALEHKVYKIGEISSHKKERKVRGKGQILQLRPVVT